MNRYRLPSRPAAPGSPVLLALLASLAGPPATAGTTLNQSASQQALARIAPDTPGGQLSFQVDAQASQLRFDLGTPAPAVVVSLTGPAGEQVTEASIAGFGGSYARLDAVGAAAGPGAYPIGSGLHHYLFQLPSLGPGSYTLRFASSALGGQAPVFAHLLSDSPIGASLFFTAAPASAGRPAVLCAALNEGSQALAGAQVDGSLLLPDGALGSLVLRDDGGDADGQAGDGLYCAALLPAAAGRYLALARIRGQSADGSAFQRQATAELEVLPRRADLSGALRDAGVDLDGNGRFEQITLAAEAEIAEAGRYRLRAALRTAGGQAFQGTADQLLDTGRQWPALSLAAGQLLALGEDGPYAIERVELLRLADEGGAALADSLLRPGQTQAYLLSQLERPAIALTGLSRDSGIDRDGNGLFERLDVALEIEVDRAGSYDYSAHLSDRNGKLIELAAGSAALDRGRAWLAFQFDGRKIGGNGVDGPYLLESLLIAGAGASRTVAGTVARSQAYRYRQFEGSSANPADVNGDGLVDCADLALVRASIGLRAGQPGFDPRSDLNHDGLSDVRDLAVVARALAVGTRCP